MTSNLSLPDQNSRATTTTDEESIQNTVSEQASFTTWDRFRDQLKDADRPKRNTPVSQPQQPSKPATEDQKSTSTNTNTNTHYTLQPDDESSNHYPLEKKPSGPYCKYPKTKPTGQAKGEEKRVQDWVDSQQCDQYRNVPEPGVPLSAKSKNPFKKLAKKLTKKLSHGK